LSSNAVEKQFPLSVAEAEVVRDLFGQVDVPGRTVTGVLDQNSDPQLQAGRRLFHPAYLSPDHGKGSTASCLDLDRKPLHNRFGGCTAGVRSEPGLFDLEAVVAGGIETKSPFSDLVVTGSGQVRCDRLLGLLAGVLCGLRRYQECLQSTACSFAEVGNHDDAEVLPAK
jgi:hypothetical protein